MNNCIDRTPCHDLRHMRAVLSNLISIMNKYNMKQGYCIIHVCDDAI